LNANETTAKPFVAAFVVFISTIPTSSYAFSPQAQQMCTGDAFRLCSSDIPDIPRVTACMIKGCSPEFG
jgi:hypothetical protein